MNSPHVDSFGSAPLRMIDGDRGKNYPNGTDFSTDGDCLFLSARNVTKSGFMFGETSFISAEKDASLRAGKVCRGDVVITTRGTVGNVAYYDNSVPFENVRINSGMLILRTEESLLDSRYLYQFVRSRSFVAQIESLTSGSAQPQLPVRDLANVMIPIPSMSQQRAVAEVLGALDEKIAANTKLVELADELAASLTRFAVDTTGSVALSEIADIVMGSSPSGSSFNETGEGTVFYQGVRDFGVRFPSNRVWTTAPVRLAMPGDTLLSVRAPVGRVNLATEETCIGRGVASVRSTHQQPFTVFHLLKDSHDAWASFEAEGTVFGSINKGQLASLQVPRLRPEHQILLETRLAPFEHTIASALSENSNLAATRDALLPQLMSGKLPVKDAEKALENAGV